MWSWPMRSRWRRWHGHRILSVRRRLEAHVREHAWLLRVEMVRRRLLLLHLRKVEPAWCSTLHLRVLKKMTARGGIRSRW